MVSRASLSLEANMIPNWAHAANFDATELKAIANDRVGWLLWHLDYYAITHRCFDVTFFARQPILQTQLEAGFRHEFRTACDHNDAKRIIDLLGRVKFADGSIAGADEIWTFNYMPDDLAIDGIDLSEGERIVGFDGQTARQIIRETYHCQSRAEEDFFLARWIAS
jgi:hypothetical protein